MKTNEFTYKVMDLNTAQLEIPRESYQRELNLAGYKKYLNQVWLMYNGSSRKNALPQKY